MADIKTLADDVYRDFVTAGVPATGHNEPAKSEIRNLFAVVDQAVGAAQASIQIVPTIADRDAFYATEENRGKLVYVNNNNGSEDDPANGVYEYVDGAPRIAKGYSKGAALVVQPQVAEATTQAGNSANSAAQADAARAAIQPFVGNFVSVPTSDTVVGGVVEATGLYLRRDAQPYAVRPSVPDNLRAIMDGASRLAIIPPLDKGLWIGSGAPASIPAQYREASPVIRGPVGIQINATRHIVLAQLKPNTTDTSPNTVCMKISDDGGKTFGPSIPILLNTDSAPITNETLYYDPTTGRLYCWFTVSPFGVPEGALMDPTTDPTKAVTVHSIYCDDPAGAVTWRGANGAVLPQPADRSLCRLEDQARDAITPYWNMSPGNPGVLTSAGEILVCGNGAGDKGSAGYGLGIQLNGFTYVAALDRATDKLVLRSKTQPGKGWNESGIFQRGDGRIQIDCRNHYAGGVRRTRLVGLSTDATASKWGEAYYDSARPDARCQGSVLRLCGGPGKAGPSIIIAANLAKSTLISSAGDRRGLTVWASFDEGDTWPWFLTLHPDSELVGVDVLGNPLPGGPVTVPYFTAYSTLRRETDFSWFVDYEAAMVYPDGSYQAPYAGIRTRHMNLLSFPQVRELLGR